MVVCMSFSLLSGNSCSLICFSSGETRLHSTISQPLSLSVLLVDFFGPLALSYPLVSNGRAVKGVRGGGLRTLHAGIGCL